MEDLTICLTYFKTERGTIHKCTVGRKPADIKTNALLVLSVVTSIFCLGTFNVSVSINEDLPVIVMLLQIRDELLLERLHWRLYDHGQRSPIYSTFNEKPSQLNLHVLGPRGHRWHPFNLCRRLKPHSEEVFLLNWVAAEESTQAEDSADVSLSSKYNSCFRVWLWCYSSGDDLWPCGRDSHITRSARCILIKTLLPYEFRSFISVHCLFYVS